MKKLLYLILLIPALFTACDDERMEELNTPSKAATVVPAETLFANGMRNAMDLMNSSSVNVNPFRMYAQYVAQTTYPEESQYNLTTRSIPFGWWGGAYRNALLDLNAAKTILNAEIEKADPAFLAGLNNQMACINIMMDFVYATLVDTFGDVPYSEALDPENLTPKYDDAATVYDAVLADLDVAIASIDVTKSGFGGVQDMIYYGDMMKWKMFANSIKLRMAMRLADVNPSKSIAAANAAMASGVITSNADNAAINYGSAAPNNNPLYSQLVLSGRQDFIGANTMVDIMNANSDPRRYVYFDENLGADTFTGGIYGTANAYSTSTHLGDAFHQADLPGTVYNAAESHFLMAEMAERGGYSVVGTAESHYNAGIQASFDQWGVSGAAAYLADASVAYTTAAGTWQQKIGTQMWLSLYNQGFEGWTTWRRLDMDILNVPEGLTYSDIPVRFHYPIREQSQNESSYNAAASKIGSDVVQTKIFWDRF